MIEQQQYMRRAIVLAKQAKGFTNPNPMVGAVIVKDGRIIGEGYHQKCGELHAERNAFKNLTEDAVGATLYVTLEPCCHYGKTPPCTVAIIDHGISKVVIGSRDPNPLVSGKGVKQLREQGIEVVEDFLREECDAINNVFFHYITRKTPYLVMKYAMTLDGKIATKSGESKWITGEGARLDVHKSRHAYMGILAGIGTVLADDPMLNVRVDGLKSPIRIICDSKLRIPIDSKIVQTAGEYRTIIVHCKNINLDKKAVLASYGIEFLEIEEKDRHLDLRQLVEHLGKMDIDSIYIEGGSTINDAFIREKLVDQLDVYIAPKILGGKDAKTPVGGKGCEKIADASLFRLEEITKIDEDIKITYLKIGV